MEDLPKKNIFMPASGQARRTQFAVVWKDNSLKVFKPMFYETMLRGRSDTVSIQIDFIRQNDYSIRWMIIWNYQKNFGGSDEILVIEGNGR